MDLALTDDFLKSTFDNEFEIGKIIHRFESNFKYPSSKFSIIVGIYKENAGRG